MTITTEMQLCQGYRRADVVFLPLLDAWANNALLEGMACGRPVVATDLPAILEYAGNAAVFVEKGSTNSAVQELLRLYLDRIFCEKLGQNARHRMVNHFSWGKIAQTYTKLYADFLF